MNQKNSNTKLNKILKFEAVLKSGLLGMAAGGVAAFLFAFVAWFLKFDGLIPALAVFALVTCVCGFCFYRKLFFPSAQRNARRLDRYGLDERMITMVELEGKDDYLSKIQREDAMKAVSMLDASRVKLKIPRVIITLAVAFGVLAMGMTAVEGLSSAGILPSGSQVWLTIFPPPPPDSFRVEYVAGEGGEIYGKPEQSVYEGEASEKVLAVAADGYMFLMWDDGNPNPSRTDKNVSKDLSFSAIFIKVSLEGFAGKDPGDVPRDVPVGQGDPNPENESQEDGSNRYQEINKIIDNNIYYRDVYAEYYQAWIDRLNSGEEIPENIRQIIEAYLKIIK